MTNEKKSDAPTPPLEKAGQNVDLMDEARQQIEGSLDTIKEILSGEHAREIHKKMSVLEDRFARELSSIQTHNKQRLDFGEAFVKRDFVLIREDLRKEHEERASSFDHAMREVKEISQSLENKI